jgi:hypothetical protein
MSQFVAAAADVRLLLAYTNDSAGANLLTRLLGRLTINGDLTGQNERLPALPALGQTPFDEGDVKSRSRCAVRNPSAPGGGSGRGAGAAWPALRTRFDGLFHG